MLGGWIEDPLGWTAAPLPVLAAEMFGVLSDSCTGAYVCFMPLRLFVLWDCMVWMTVLDVVFGSAPFATEAELVCLCCSDAMLLEFIPPLDALRGLALYGEGF